MTMVNLFLMASASARGNLLGNCQRQRFLIDELGRTGAVIRATASKRLRIPPCANASFLRDGVDSYREFKFSDPNA